MSKRVAMCARTMCGVLALVLCAGQARAQGGESAAREVSASAQDVAKDVAKESTAPAPAEDDEPEGDDAKGAQVPVRKSSSQPDDIVAADPVLGLSQKDDNLGVGNGVTSSKDGDEAAQEPASLTATFGDVTSTFVFGSYGRVQASTDFEGGRARQLNVVSHGSRIDESSYAELEFQQRFLLPESATQSFFMSVVSTLALGDDLFHFTGEFDQSIALRNLYAEGGWRLAELTLSFWGGSRMYRGDDIYLLDFWPLDNLNTVGGGAAIAYDLTGRGRSELKLHAGASRLQDAYQFQTVPVPGVDFGADEVVFLNRQRTIASARFQQDLWLTRRADHTPKTGAKLVLYGERHTLPEGQRRIIETNEVERLPADSGRKLGAELGLWSAHGLLKGSFINLFFAHSTALATFGEFGIPRGVSASETSQGARMRMIAASADLETPYAGLLLGSYYKRFQDADGQSIDFDDHWEAILAARLHIYATRHIHPGVEYSYQVRSPQGPYAGTNAYEVPTASKLSLIQAITLDRGMYSRPQLRLIYTRTVLNASAVALFATDDPRRDNFSGGRLVSHYGGVGVEWWFNNASLFRP